MKHLIVLVICLSFFVVSCGCMTRPAPEPVCQQKVTILKGVNFDYNKSTIKPESYPILDKNVETLKSRPSMTTTIVGHTDNDGTTAYNQKLSEERANAVMQYFIQKGISADRVKAIGKGESAPIADNNTDAGKAQNRRIEIEFADPDPDIICK